MSKACEHQENESCQENMIRVEKSLWYKLSIWGYIKMRFHLFICKNCKAYEKDSKLIHRVLCSLKKPEKVAGLREDEMDQLKKALL